MELGLKGRHVLITGASRGIGRACAEVFAAEGGRLDLVSRSKEDLEALAARLHRDHAVEVTIHPMDLSLVESQIALNGELPEVDIVVNNAGAIPGGDLQQIDDATWRAAWDLKVFGYVNICRLLLPRLEAQGRGVIVNVIGGAGVRPQPSYITGGAGNAALMAVTQALGSHSLRHNVRVVGVNPGLIMTDRLTDLLRAQAETRFGDPERWGDLIPDDAPPGQPEQVADVVAFLASDRASHVSGVTLAVDGGSTAR